MNGSVIQSKRGPRSVARNVDETMHAKRIELAKSVASCLFAAERAIDVAASRTAELNAIMPMARLDGGMSAMIGQDAFEASTHALICLAEARQRIVDTHRHLKEASDEIGLRALNFGDSIKPPTKAGLQSPEHLRVAS